jgi:ferric-dicitrate binding protein FerR (iron transport regulator)
MTLAPATTAQVAAGTITIDGEAYFEIAPRLGHPFVVQTANTTVRVLGTKFSVRQYVGESKSRVVVEDGKVAVLPLRPRGMHDAPTVIAAQMSAQVTDSGVTVTRGVAIRDYTGWMHGTLTFNEVPLRDVVVELARAYGATIRVADTVLATRSMIMEVSVNQQSLRRVLDLISVAAGAHYRLDGDTYVLLPGRATTPTTPRQQFSQPEMDYGK